MSSRRGKIVRWMVWMMFLGVRMVSGQEDPQLSQFMFSKLTYNPGFAGSNGGICVTGLNRQQWVGFKGAPSTTIFQGEAFVKPFGLPSGVGLTFTSDKLGFENNLSITGTYAYRLELGSGTLGIGLSLGLINKSIDPTWEVPTSDYHTPPSGDPLIPDNKESAMAFDMGLGLYYHSDEFYVGVSSTHLNAPVIKYTEGEPFIARHYYVVAGYNLRLPDPSFEILPAFFLQSDGKATQFSLNLNVLYNKKVWGGVSYRTGDAIVGMIGLQLMSGLRIGYAYDFQTSEIRNNTGGSHEVMVKYCFNLSLQREPKSYKSIRFL